MPYLEPLFYTLLVKLQVFVVQPLVMVKKDDVHLVKSISGVGFPCGG
jgi:hypothetical protein